MRLLLQSTMICTCNLTTRSPLQSDLALHVTVDTSSRCKTLQVLVDRYFGNDTIEGYQCDYSKCTSMRATRKVKLLSPLPHTISIHLLRTFLDSTGLGMPDDKIDFDEFFTVKKEYCVGDDTSNTGAIGDTKYWLMSVIEDNGSVNICYKLFKGQWYYMSDSSIHKTDWRDVADCQAYILFYETEE